MRTAFIVTIALLLAGCEHLYGSMDTGRLAPVTAPLGSR